MKKILLILAACSTLYANAQIITIAAARKHAIGDTVSVKGIISCGSEINANQRFIQDGTGGISIYGAAIGGANLGDSVLVKGAVNSYKGLLELNPNASFTPTTYTTGNKRHAPRVTTIQKGGGWDTTTQGLLVRVNGITFSKTTGSTLTAATNYYIISGTDSAQIRIPANSNFGGMNTPKGKCGLIGLMGVYCASAPCGPTTYQLLPIDTTTDLLRSTGIDNVSAENMDVNIYPNPAVNELNINMNNVSNAALVSIYALDGKMVYQNKSANYLTVNTNNWCNGVYLVSITGQNATITRKVVIAK